MLHIKHAIYTICIFFILSPFLSSQVSSSVSEWKEITGKFWSINSVAFSPNGKLLASAGTHKTIKIWSLPEGREYVSLPVDSWVVNTVAFSPKGDLLASGSGNNKVCLWDVTTGTLRKTLLGHFGSVETVSFSPDGKLLASGSSDRKVKVWSLPSGENTHTFSHQGGVYTTEFSPDGEILASAGWEGKIKLWSIKEKRFKRSWRGHQSSIECLRFSPDGKLLASASRDKTIKVWSTRNGKLIKTLKGHKGKVYTLSFSPDSRILASGSNDKTIHLWSIKLGVVLEKWQGHSERVWTVCYHPKKNILASGGWDKTLKLWEIKNLEEVEEQAVFKLLPQLDIISPQVGREHTSISSLRVRVNVKNVDSDNVYLVGANQEKRRAQDIISLEGDKNSFIWDLDLIPGQNKFSLFARNKYGNSTKEINISYIPEEFVKTSLDRTFTNRSDTVWSVNFSPDGKFLATAGESKTIDVWLVENQSLLLSLEGHGNGISQVCFSPDGKILASASFDKTIKLWSLSEGKLLTTFLGHQDYIWSVSFSPDGKFLASAGNDRMIKVWSVSERVEVATLTDHQGSVNSLAFSPDGETLVSASDDHLIVLWSWIEGKKITSLQGHQDWVQAICFSPDGKILASAGRDQKIYLWSMKTGEILKTIPTELPIEALSFHRSGNFFAGGGAGGDIQVWSSITSILLATIKGHSEGIHTLAFSRNQDLLASSGDDCSLKVWRVEGAEPSQEGNRFVPEIHLLSPGARLHKTSSSIFRIVAQITNVEKLDEVRLNYQEKRFFPLKEHQLEDGFVVSWDVDLLEKENDFEIVAINNHGTQAQKLQIELRSTEFLQGSFWKSLPSKQQDIYSTDFHPSGTYLVCGGSEEAQVWETKSGKLLYSFAQDQGFIRDLAFHPDGKSIALAGGNGQVTLWSFPDGNRLSTLSGHEGVVSSLAFSPDGKYLLSGSDDETMRLWNLEEDEVDVFSPEMGPIFSVAFSPDGETFGCGGESDKIKLWSFSRKSLLKVLDGHKGGVWSLCFSPTGEVIASAGIDKAIRLWFIKTGEEFAALKGHQENVTELAFHPSGRILASSSWDQSVRLWSIQTGTLISTLNRHSDWVWGVTFDETSNTLASAGDDSSLYLWQISETERLPSIAPEVYPKIDVLHPLTVPFATFSDTLLLSASFLNIDNEEDVRVKLKRQKIMAIAEKNQYSQGITLSWKVDLLPGANTIEIVALNAYGSTSRKVLVWKSSDTIDPEVIEAQGNLSIHAFLELAKGFPQENILISPTFMITGVNDGLGEGIVSSKIFQDTAFAQISASRIKDNSTMLENYFRNLYPTVDIKNNYTAQIRSHQNSTRITFLNENTYQGSWLLSFGSDSTRKRAFFLSKRKSIDFPMMSQLGYYLYHQEDGFQAVALPYAGGDMFLYLFLPDEQEGLSSFYEKLNYEKWGYWLKKFQPMVGHVVLPRFQQKCNVFIDDIMKPMFSSNLSLSKTKPLPLDQNKLVLPNQFQQNNIFFVEEKGEAHIVSQEELGPPQQMNIFEMILNRPFFYVIGDSNTKTIFFLGQLVHPNENL